jgi:hypothetical protein
MDFVTSNIYFFSLDEPMSSVTQCNPIFGKFVPDLRYLKTYLMPGLRYLLGVCMTSLHRAWSSKFNRISILHHCKVKVGEVMEKDRKYWFNCLMLYKHCGES